MFEYFTKNPGKLKLFHRFLRLYVCKRYLNKQKNSNMNIAETPEFINAALELNAAVKSLHKQIDVVGYKSREGRELLEKNEKLYQEFADVWGIELLLRAKFINQKKVSNWRTIVNKKSREDY